MWTESGGEVGKLKCDDRWKICWAGNKAIVISVQWLIVVLREILYHLPSPYLITSSPTAGLHFIRLQLYSLAHVAGLATTLLP